VSKRVAVYAVLSVLVPVVLSTAVSANQSQFRGNGWYIRDPYIVDVVHEGPFATEQECIKVVRKKYPSKPGLKDKYCQYLTGPA
jgi:hypothetical protein